MEFEILMREMIEEAIKPKIAQLREEIETLRSDDFISYPGGLEEHLNCSYDSAYRLWTKQGFPRAMNGGIKGVYKVDLKRFLVHT